MLRIVYQDLHPHSGMTTYLRGLHEIAGGVVSLHPESELADLQPRPGDLVLFNDQLNDAYRACMQRWISAGHGDVRYGVLLHSPVLQMDISNELGDTISLLREIQEQGHHIRLFCADQDTAGLLQKTTPALGTTWLPHCLPDFEGNGELPPKIAGTANGDPKIWMPLTIHDQDDYYRHKNTHAQIAALAIITRETNTSFEVLTNYASPLLRECADFFKLNITEVGSLPPQEHRALLDETSLGLCASLSESFSYNAIDLMLAGVPTIFGPALTWAWQDLDVVRDCGVVHPGSTQEIAEKIERLLASSDCYLRASRNCQALASRTVLRNHQAARDQLATLVPSSGSTPLNDRANDRANDRGH